ncbi:hypothetical protein D3C71_1954200 [compost metagenome]
MHGHPHQLVRHFHGDLVVGDVDELHAFTHFLDQTRVAPDVGIVQRRIDLVEHAERCGVQLEDGKHQRQCGQCLLAAGQQMDGAVLLARRSRHDRYPCIE